MPKAFQKLPFRRRWWLTWIAFLVWAAILNGAEDFKELGAPFIRNYSPEEYNSHYQNWAVALDKRGVVYFGTSNSGLEFDGRFWNLIQTPNNTVIRSLAVDPFGRIWVGGFGEIGFLAVNHLGQTEYISLLAKIPKDQRDFNDVFKTYATSHGVYFFSFKNAFCHRNGEIRVLPVDYIRRSSFKADDEIFFGQSQLGLFWLNRDQATLLPHSQGFASGTYFFGTSFRPRQLLIIKSSGECFIYDLRPYFDPATSTYDFSRDIPSKEVIHPFRTELSRFINPENSLVNEAVKTTDNRFYFATSKSGILVMDEQGRIIRVINRNRGLLDNNVWNLCLDAEQNIWAALNAGISYVQIHSPVSFFNSANDLEGYLTAAVRFQDRILASSFNGIKLLQPYTPSPRDDNQRFVPLISDYSECWSSLILDRFLILGANPNALLINDRFQIKAYPTDYIYCLGNSAKFPDVVFAGLMDGMALFHIQRPGPTDMELKFDNTVFKNFKAPVRIIVSDENGDLWLMTPNSGLAHVKFRGRNLNDYQIVPYTTADGLPQMDLNFPFFMGSRLLVGTPQGIYEGIPPASGNGKFRFIPENTIGKFFSHPPVAVQGVVPAGKDRWLIQSSIGFAMARLMGNGSYEVDFASFKALPTTEDSFYLDSRGILWVPTPKGLFRFDTFYKKETRRPFPTVIRKVIAGKDRILLSGNFIDPDSSEDGHFTRMRISQPPEASIRLPFHDNAITFHFSALFNENESSLRFRTQLAGFDKNWSDWLEQNAKEYTNLPEGSYLFRVQAKNIYDTEGREAWFRFSIVPPWQRTVFAYIAYFIIAFLAIAGIVKAYTYRLQREKNYLEKLVTLRSEELKEASLTDPLTGLRNRRYISDILNSDIIAFAAFKRFNQENKNRRNIPDFDHAVFGVYMIDIDHFKSINDTYGHNAGDKLLCQLAQLLRQTARENDAVMRIGGEEFLLVLKKILPENMSAFAKRLMSQIQAADFDLEEGIKQKRTCSIGFTTFPFYDEEPELISFEQTIQIADRGLYFAKTHGRNLAVCIQSTDNLPADAEEIKKMCASLEYALEKRYFNVNI